MVAITGACPPYFVAHHRNNVTLSGAFFHLRISDQHLNVSPHFALRSNSTAPVLLKGVRRRAGLRLDVQAVNEGCERTYVMVKPDGVQRGLVGEIISKFEKKGFLLRGLKLLQCPEDLAKAHYTELKEKPFYTKLVNYIISGPVVGMVWEGPGVVAAARKLIGSTNPLQAEPGTIRGDLAIEVGRNVVHGSDSPINGEREIALWFNEGELIEWDQTMAPWLRE